MDTLLEGLPAEIRSRVHPDWVHNEAAYWVARADLAKRTQASGLPSQTGMLSLLASGSWKLPTKRSNSASMRL